MILAWAWCFIAIVAGAGVILGETGGLGGNGFWFLHLALLGVFIVWRGRRCREDFKALRQLLKEAQAFFHGCQSERALGVTAATILIALSALAAFAYPVIYDAHAYHLPKAAHWLQDGHIRFLSTQDERLNFVTGLSDLVTVWILTATLEGFHFVNLPQAVGGIMTFAATVGLSRLTGLGRTGAIMSGFLLFGMANVVVQFTATQTDLFTAGLFSTAVFLWLCALKRGEASVLGGLGAGLALAAKGTLFYLTPGALLWVGWLMWQHPSHWTRWRTTILAAVTGVFFFAGPGLVHNKLAYGSVFGPREWVEKLHRPSDSGHEFIQKIWWNFQATLAQNFEPNSQPTGLRTRSLLIGQSLAESLPEHDKFTLDNVSRKATLQKDILPRTEADADVTSFGTVTLLLFVFGLVVALMRWRRADARLALAWGMGVVVFFIFFEAKQQWHPFAFRYFVLVSPWIAIVAAWGIEQFPSRWKMAVWILVLIASADVGWRITTNTHQAGWRALTQPERSRGYFVSSSWRNWSEQLDPIGASLSVALPEERPLAAFYRQYPRRTVNLKLSPAPDCATAEEFIGSDAGWIIVPATRFLGSEGNVKAATWLLNGDESSPYSVAGYRRLFPGEQSGPIIYRHKRVQNEHGNSAEFLVKIWTDRPVNFSLINPSGKSCEYTVATPLKVERRIVNGPAETIAITLPAGKVSHVVFSFKNAPSDQQHPNYPTAEFVAE